MAVEKEPTIKDNITKIEGEIDSLKLAKLEQEKAELLKFQTTISDKNMTNDEEWDFIPKDVKIN